MDNPTSAAPDALSRAFDEYIAEVGPDAVAAAFDVPVESVNEKRLTAPIIRFLFARAEEQHENDLRTLRQQLQNAPRRMERDSPTLVDPNIPDAQQQPIRRLMPGQSSDWITPVPNKKDSGPVPNSPVM